MSIYHSTRNFVAFSLCLLPLTVTAQDTSQPPTGPTPPPISAPVTVHPPSLPTAVLLYRCDTVPEKPTVDVMPRVPGTGLVPPVTPVPQALPGEAGDWCTRALTADELDITQACVGALTPEKPGQ